MKRDEVLSVAHEYITKDRAATHGGAEDNFTVIADLWTVYLAARQPGPLLSHDVAALMVLFKVARITNNPVHEDNWVDTAGYAALGSELAERAWKVVPDEAR